MNEKIIHEVKRREFWVEVFLKFSGNSFEVAARIANNALEEYDKKFPEPPKNESP